MQGKNRFGWRFFPAIGTAATWLLCLAALVCRAERLPIRTWTAADGLPHNHINRIIRDSHNYLWICTDEGLARFDGYRFVKYGTAQGLPSLTVNDFIETRDGTYWVATDGGVCLFNPLGKAAPPNTNLTTPMFTAYRVSEREDGNRVNGLLADPDGSLWLATSGGLVHLRQTGRSSPAQINAVEIGYPTGYRDERHVTKLAFDSHGALWAMAISGLYRRSPGGHWEHYNLENGPTPENFVQSFFEDRQGRLWIGSRNRGLYRLVSAPQPGRPIVEQTYSVRDGLPGLDVRNIVSLPDGRVWLCVVGGLVLFNPEASDNAKFITYTKAHGLTTEEVYNLAEDREGNLWIGTRDSGAMRIASSDFATFGPADGFSPGVHNTICETGNGELLIFNGSYPQQRFLHHFNGKTFVGMTFQAAHAFGYAQRQAVLQDHLGEWWVATDEGLYRYPSLNQVAYLA